MKRSTVLGNPNRNARFSGAESRFYGFDSALAYSGEAFLQAELEKHRPQIIEPLTSVTWDRDIPFEMGGGWVETLSSYFSDYATAGTSDGGLISTAANELPLIQANLSKDNWGVHTFQVGMSIKYTDDKKWEYIGRDLRNILQTGVQLDWNKELDETTYFGSKLSISNGGTAYGLLNNPNVTESTAAASAQSGNPTTWGTISGTTFTPSTKTPTEIVNDVDSAVEATWINSNYDITGIANHVLIPPPHYGYINRTPMTLNGNPLTITILQYLEENNVLNRLTNGKEKLKIFPCRQTVGAGNSTTNRMMTYRHDLNRVRLDILVPLMPLQTEWTATKMSWITPFVSRFSQVQFLAYQTANYVDAI